MDTATNETTNLTHWKDLVWKAASPRWAIDGTWFRGERANGYLCRAYAAGEPVWMAAKAIVAMWQGELRARREEAGTIGSALRACRAAS